MSADLTTALELMQRAMRELAEVVAARELAAQAELQEARQEWPTVLTLDDAAQLLRCERTWVYRRVRSGDLPSFRVGNHVRIQRDALLAWITEQSTSPVPACASAPRRVEPSPPPVKLKPRVSLVKGASQDRRQKRG